MCVEFVVARACACIAFEFFFSRGERNAFSENKLKKKSLRHYFHIRRADAKREKSPSTNFIMVAMEEAAVSCRFLTFLAPVPHGGETFVLIKNNHVGV